MENQLSTYKPYGRILTISHALLSVFLAAFFIYAGIKKFIPKPPSTTPANNAEYIKAFEENTFENPINFKMGVKALKVSGFLKMVGIIQILSGVLIIIPFTRLIGLLMLLPITVNVFCFHFFMDNRTDENIETGFFLILNSSLLLFYLKQLGSLIIKKRSELNPL
jgi:uncharacterized membrane protein YphA (DoxX/SURF4 family)